MRIFGALKHRQVRWLWGGQVFSAMGDEVYNIALVWYAASLMGTRAGYISAVQAGSLFFFSLVGGTWADHRDHRQVMIFADLARAAAVLCLPVYACFAPLPLALVIAAAVVVSSFEAFFSPARGALVPQLTQDPQLLQATNGLMETTTRFARVIGPGTVALLSRMIPLIHYFSVDAVSYLISAYSISRVQPEAALVPALEARVTLMGSLKAGLRLSKSDPMLRFLIYSSAVSAAAWVFVLPLGMTLLLREKLPTNVGGLGMLVFAYGVGNLSSNLLASNFTLHRPERWVFTGRLIAGVGILLLSRAASLEGMMVASALTAVGGPLVDLGFVSYVQSRVRGRDLARLWRFLMAVEQGTLLMVYLSSPKLFQFISVPAVIGAAGALVFLSGLAGFPVVRRKPARSAR